MVGALKVKEGLIQSGQIYQSAEPTTRLRHTQHLFLIASIAILEPPFPGFSPEITQGEALWYHLQQGNERAQPMMNLTNLTRRQAINHPLTEPLENIGSRGLSFCAEQWVWILRFAPAARE
jgi:hypothetical protein